MRPYVLAETTWKSIKDSAIDLAVLPWGATEAHNYHLPFGTDNFMVEKIACESARLAYEKGTRLVVLPNIPFGVNTGQLDIRLNINMNPSTQMAVLNDITDVLVRHKIRKFMILNGHGGNDFKQIIRELGFRFPDIFICACNWYQSFETSDFFENGGGHADEMETSMMQFLFPELVLPLNEAGEGKGKKFSINALNQKWAWAERRWTRVTNDTGIGDPSKATPEKGEKCFNVIVDKLSTFMTDLASTSIEDMYK